MGLFIAKVSFIFYILKIYYHIKLNYSLNNKTFSLLIFLKDLMVLNHFSILEGLPFYVPVRQVNRPNEINLEKRIKRNSYMFLVLIILSFFLAYNDY